MNRTELEKYIRNNYGTEPNYPWISIRIMEYSAIAVIKNGLPGADEHKNEP